MIPVGKSNFRKYVITWDSNDGESLWENLYEFDLEDALCISEQLIAEDRGYL